MKVTELDKFILKANLVSNKGDFDWKQSLAKGDPTKISISTVDRMKRSLLPLQVLPLMFSSSFDDPRERLQPMWEMRLHRSSFLCYQFPFNLRSKLVRGDGFRRNEEQMKSSQML